MNSSSAEAYLKIGDVARRVGVSPSVIRSWESLGLTRPRRTESKYRLYTADDVKLLKRARFLRKVRGLNAAAIVELLRREGRARPAADGNAGAIGSHLRQLRAKQKISLAQVARAVGISVGFLSALERSQMSGSVGTLRKLARFYKTNILDFFDATGASTRQVRPAQRKVLEAGSWGTHGVAGLGKYGDGAASVSGGARRGQRRFLHARGRRVPLRVARSIDDHFGEGRVPAEDWRQFLFRERDSSSLEKSGADRDFTVVGKHAADFLSRIVFNQWLRKSVMNCEGIWISDGQRY